MLISFVCIQGRDCSRMCSAPVLICTFPGIQKLIQQKQNNNTKSKKILSLQETWRQLQPMLVKLQLYITLKQEEVE